MENFSTHQPAVLPRATNLATLAVVVAATWWSGAQRPTGPAPMAQVAVTSAAAQSAALPVQQTASLTPAGATATTTPTQSSVFWPAEAAANIARDGLQAVGFKTASQR